jgi:HNH endonuclease
LSGYSINGFEQKIGQFILEFISKVGKESSSANEGSTDPFVRYAYFRKFTFLYVKEKYEIMASQLLRSIPNMKRKDRQRHFNDIERLAICMRAKGKCEFCERDTPLVEGHADHIIRHTDGGLTIVENGRWLCEMCHINHHSSLI